MLGSVLADRFEIQAHLGDGAVASVWQAWDKKLGMQVAIKLLHPYLSRDNTSIERLRREIVAARRAQGEGVVAMHDLLQAGEQVFLVQDLYTGGDLAKKPGPLPTQTVVAIGQQIAQALHRAHRAGVLHRDIKPANILVDAQGHYALGDFGLARLQDQAGGTATSLLAGTIGYTAPEVLRGVIDDPRSDQYALAATLYELATGHLPFTGTPAVILERKLHGELAPPANLPAPIAAVLLKALSREAAARFSTLLDFSQALQAAVEGVMPERASEAQACRVCGGPLVVGLGRCPRCGQLRVMVPRSTMGPFKVHVYAPNRLRHIRMKMGNNMDRFTFDEKRKIVETTVALTGASLQNEAELDAGLSRTIVEAADGLSEAGAIILRDQLKHKGFDAEILGPGHRGRAWTEWFTKIMVFLPMFAGIQVALMIAYLSLTEPQGPPMGIALLPLTVTSFVSFMLYGFVQPRPLLKPAAQSNAEAQEPPLPEKIQTELMEIPEGEVRELVAEVFRAVGELRTAAVEASAPIQADMEDAALSATRSALDIGTELGKLPIGEGVELRATLLEMAAGLRGSATALRKNRANTASLEGQEALARLKAATRAATTLPS